MSDFPIPGENLSQAAEQPAVVFDLDNSWTWMQSTGPSGPITDFEFVHYGGSHADRNKQTARMNKLHEIQQIALEIEDPEQQPDAPDSITVMASDLFAAYKDRPEGYEPYMAKPSVAKVRSLADFLSRKYALAEVDPIIDEQTGLATHGGPLLSVTGAGKKAQVSVTRSPIRAAVRIEGSDGDNSELFEQVDAEHTTQSRLRIRGLDYRKRVEEQQNDMLDRFPEIDETVFGWQQAEAWQVEAGERTFLLGFDDKAGSKPAAARAMAVAQAIELLQTLANKEEYAQGVGRTEFRAFLTYAVAIHQEDLKPKLITQCVDDALYMLEFLQHQDGEDDEPIVVNEMGSILRISPRVHDLQITRYEDSSDVRADETRFRDPRAEPYVPPFMDDESSPGSAGLTNDEIAQVDAFLNGTDTSEQAVIQALTTAGSRALTLSYSHKTRRNLSRRRIVELARGTTMSQASVDVALENRWLSDRGEGRNVRGVRMTAGQAYGSHVSNESGPLGPLFVIRGES